MNKGFTLVELIIVVIIIGILASVGIPQYNKTMERSRISEASSILGALRGAQLRYKLENGSYATDPSTLDMDMPAYDGTANRGKFFEYSIGTEALGITATAIATAVRIGNQYTIKISDEGKVYCASADCSGFISQ